MAAKKKKPTAERTPIVALLGHVDHGKTTILDSIRKSSIQEGEEGGITQGISVYSVKHDDKDVTFIDTPGHEAFDLMRSRGGNAADIVLLIVAANDSVKPQTKESIEIIKEAKKPVIVVINKVDISGIDLQKVKRDLSNEGIVVESMSGDVPCVEVSGKTGKGIPELLEMIHLVAEVSQLQEKETPDPSTGEAVVLESTKDPSMGNVSTLVVTGGEFSKGSYIGYLSPKRKKPVLEKIKGFIDEFDKPRSEINQGYGARILGVSELIPLGDVVYGFEENTKEAEKLIADKKVVTAAVVAEEPKPTPEEEEGEESTDADLLSMILGDDSSEVQDQQTLSVVIKANSKGTLDAIESSLKKLIKKELVAIVSSGVGDITINDVETATDTKAIVLGFKVQIDPVAKSLAEKSGVLAKVYEIIYELTDEIADAAEGLQEPDEVEEEVGSANVRKIFEMSDGSTVIGVRVESGDVKHGSRCKIVRDGEDMYDGKILSMRCEKDKIQKSGKGTECGVVTDIDGDIKEGDILQCYRIVKV